MITPEIDIVGPSIFVKIFAARFSNAPLPQMGTVNMVEETEV